MQYSSLNHLPQSKPLYQLRRTPFMEIDDKGVEVVQRYESLFELWGEIEKIEHRHGQRGSNIEGCKGIKHSWIREAHK
jgi:hypothetical protein